MSYDISSPLNWTAVDRCRESIVDNKRNTVRMSSFGEFFNIENSKRRIGNGLAENELCVVLKCGVEFLLCAVGGDKSSGDTHFAIVTAMRLKVPP